MSIFESFYNKMQDDPQKTINNVVKIDKPNPTYSYESRLKPLADVWSTKPIQYPVYIKWFEPRTEEKESLIYFNEPVHIKHDVLNKIMSVVNDKNQCLFITHQNNVEYMHVGSQPPVYLATHMNIPVEKKESAFCDGCHGCIYAGEKCTNPEPCVRDNAKLTGYTSSRQPETKSDCRTCFHNGYRCTYPEEITIDKDGICSGHTTAEKNLTEGKE